MCFFALMLPVAVAMVAQSGIVAVLPRAAKGTRCATPHPNLTHPINPFFVPSSSARTFNSCHLPVLRYVACSHCTECSCSRQISRPDFAEYFSGNKVLPGAEPAAHCYCGHQFGYFSGQLGDGATMYLGEVG